MVYFSHHIGNVIIPTDELHDFQNQLVGGLEHVFFPIILGISSSQLRNSMIFKINWLVVWNIFYFSHHIGNVIIQTDELHDFQNQLVGGLEHECYFSHHIGNVIIPTDELHHFSEGFKLNHQPDEHGFSSLLTIANPL